jgi:hypothetical protein
MSNEQEELFRQLDRSLFRSSLWHAVQMAVVVGVGILLIGLL